MRDNTTTGTTPTTTTTTTTTTTRPSAASTPSPALGDPLIDLSATGDIDDIDDIDHPYSAAEQILDLAA